MRFVVDLNRCQSYAQCCFLAPETFKFLGEEALVYDPEPDDTQSESILRARVTSSVATGSFGPDRFTLVSAVKSTPPCCRQ